MTTLPAFTCNDLFRFSNINLDPLTETYGIPCYLQYLAHWPECFIVAEAPGGELWVTAYKVNIYKSQWFSYILLFRGY
ncbi:unnamed protein product [Nyctereutes procyonoides]|uniref:(raccoon dog) hypothetical protein n=1 Tax=Nyctereutes procyonoides TaxID=34880 RepID=A0A811Y023_NYCPR|nr:unnamed protein product [Nyctereutes procyonoides]